MMTSALRHHYGFIIIPRTHSSAFDFIAKNMSTIPNRTLLLHGRSGIRCQSWHLYSSVTRTRKQQAIPEMQSTRAFCKKIQPHSVSNLSVRDQTPSPPHHLCKLYSQHKMPQTHVPKCQSSTHCKHLSTDDVFSQERRAQMVSRTSKIRVPRRLFNKGKVLKHASVLVPLCTICGEPALLLTLRSTNLSKHRGEVSFPGGMQDPNDADAVETALREAKEELGIKPDDVDIWCQLPAIPSKAQNPTAVASVVGFLGEIDVDNLMLNSSEVEDAFIIPLSKLLDPPNQRYTRFTPSKGSSSKPYALPVFLGGTYRVWGMTAIIIDAVLQAWLPEHYTSLYARLQLYGQK